MTLVLILAVVGIAYYASLLLVDLAALRERLADSEDERKRLEAVLSIEQGRNHHLNVRVSDYSMQIGGLLRRFDEFAQQIRKDAGHDSLT